MLFNFFWSSFSLWLIQFFDASTWWKCYSNNNGRSGRCARDGYSSIKYFLIIEWFIDSKWRRVHDYFVSRLNYSNCFLNSSLLGRYSLYSFAKIVLLSSGNVNSTTVLFSSLQRIIPIVEFSSDNFSLRS